MDDRLELTYEKTPEEEQAELTEKAKHLIEFGLPPNLFNRTAAYTEGYTYKFVYKMVKTVAHYHNSGHLEGIIALGSQKGFYDSHTTMNLDQFVNLAKFLNTKEGQYAVQGVQQLAKLMKKSGNMFTPKEVALLELLRIQREDYQRVMKEEMSSYNKEIEYCREQIRELERGWEERENELNEEFENKVRDLYTTDAESKGFKMKWKEAGGVEDDIVGLGEQVKRAKGD